MTEDSPISFPSWEQRVQTSLQEFAVVNREKPPALDQFVWLFRHAWRVPAADTKIWQRFFDLFVCAHYSKVTAGYLADLVGDFLEPLSADMDPSLWAHLRENLARYREQATAHTSMSVAAASRGLLVCFRNDYAAADEANKDLWYALDLCASSAAAFALEPQAIGVVLPASPA